MQYTLQETRFLERLGITPGPWRLDKSGNYIYAGYGVCEIKNNGADGQLITKAPEMFLSLFKLACEYRKLYYGQILDEAIQGMESATSKTFDQLLELCEECAE